MDVKGGAYPLTEIGRGESLGEFELIGNLPRKSALRPPAVSVAGAGTNAGTASSGGGAASSRSARGNQGALPV